MHITKILIIALVLLWSAQGLVYGQECHTDTLKAFIELCPKQTILGGKTWALEYKVAPIIKKVEQEGGIPWKGTAEEYLGNAVMDDITEYIFLPAFKDRMSTSDMQELMDSLKTTRGRSYMEHTNTFWQHYLEKLAQAVTNPAILMYIHQGSSASPIRLRNKVSKNYKNLFNQYYDSPDATFLFKGDLIQDVMEENFRLVFSNEGRMVGKSVRDRLFAYIQENSRTIALDACSETLSEEDLNFAIKLFTLPSYQKFILASESMDSVIEQFTENVPSYYKTWVSEQEQNDVQFLYKKGNDCLSIRDYKGAYEYFLKAAEAGYGPAMSVISDMYDRGIYVTRDREKAKEWKRKYQEALSQ